MDIKFARVSDEQLIRRLMNGQSVKDICLDLGLDPRRTADRVKSPEFQAELYRREMEKPISSMDELETRARKNMLRMASVAQEVTENLMLLGKSEQTRLKAAEGIMDRAGGAFSRKAEMAITHHFDANNLTDNEIKAEVLRRLSKIDESEKQRAIDMEHRVEFDQVVDVEAVLIEDNP